MKKLHLITIIFGTRPEAIKLAPLILNLKKSKTFETRVIFTGQHIEMVHQVMNIFGIKYDSNLNLMTESQSLTHITNEVIIGLEKEFIKFRPSIVLVQGDTSTAFSAALAAFYQNIPIGHVEAGLRTNDLLKPFPEEGNRRLISQISTLHFAPTEKSKVNLINSGALGEIVVTGNTVIDSLLMVSKKCSKFSWFHCSYNRKSCNGACFASPCNTRNRNPFFNFGKCWPIPYYFIFDCFRVRSTFLRSCI